MLRALHAHASSLPNAWRPERANQRTHAVGFFLSILAGGVMLSSVWNASDTTRFFGCAVYAVAMVALYGASTLSHSFEEGPYREFYRMLAQVCIFLFMAACFTPFALTHLRGPYGYGILGLMWAVALTGVLIRVRSRAQTFPIALFIPLGGCPCWEFTGFLKWVSGRG